MSRAKIRSAVERQRETGKTETLEGLKRQENELKAPEPTPKQQLNRAQFHREKNRPKTITFADGTAFDVKPPHPLDIIGSKFMPFGIAGDDPAKVNEEFQKKIMTDFELYQETLICMSCVNPVVIPDSERAADADQNELNYSELSRIERNVLYNYISQLMNGVTEEKEVLLPF